MIAVLNIEDIEEGSSKGLEANSIYMFAVKKDDQIYLYWNRCPHLGTPLEWGHFLGPLTFLAPASSSNSPISSTPFRLSAQKEIRLVLV